MASTSSPVAVSRLETKARTDLCDPESAAPESEPRLAVSRLHPILSGVFDRGVVGEGGEVWSSCSGSSEQRGRH